MKSVFLEVTEMPILRTAATFTGIRWALGAGPDLQDGMTVQRAAALRPALAQIGGLVTA